MHAFLVTGSGNRQKEVDRIVDIHGKNSLEFSIKKIDDVRELNKFVKLTINSPTCIIIKNIDEATTQALNAFLKNLEEPQKNIKFILTAKSQKSVLSTISSRCHLIKSTSKEPQKEDEKSKKFIELTTTEKIKFIDKIKKRDEAKKFLENLIITCHTMLHKENEDNSKLAKMMKKSSQSLSKLTANGNVSLQLTDFVLNLEQP